MLIYGVRHFFGRGQCDRTKMVRQDKHSDESESDWDSLSESGHPAAHPPVPAVQQQTAVMKN